jgi:16S rRNA (cytosine1402-N4)-methyltransferase
MEYHLPILLEESVTGLIVNPNGIYIDATFGGGGHAKEILRQLSPQGTLIAIDQDIDAHKNAIDDPRLNVIFGNFRYLRNYLDYFHIDKIDGVLADLGISSHQIDDQQRGFAFRLGGRLDMRMNQNQELDATYIINRYTDDQLFYIFKHYCDIINPGKIVSAVVSQRKIKNIETIEEFVKLISPFAPKMRENKYLAQIFQAIRIEVNDEIKALEEFLNSLKNCIKIGGRMAVISYHSLEDKLVKNTIRYGQTTENQEFNVFGQKEAVFKAVSKGVIVPTDTEIDNNSRAKSAKLRIAEKI